MKSLEGIAVFKGLPAERLKALALAADWREFKAGQEISPHLDMSRRVGFLISGRARGVMYAASGTVVGFGDIMPGSMFGEITAIDGQPRAIAVEAVEDSLVAHLDHGLFLALIRDEPTFAMALITQICWNVRGLTARVVEFSTMPVNSRVQAELVRLAETKGQPKDGGILIADTPTHADLASRLSTHREAVTREINRLVKIGMLAKRSEGLLVVNLKGLTKLVQDATDA